MEEIVENGLVKGLSRVGEVQGRPGVDVISVPGLENPDLVLPSDRRTRR